MPALVITTYLPTAAEVGSKIPVIENNWTKWYALSDAKQAGAREWARRRKAELRRLAKTHRLKARTTTVQLSGPASLGCRIAGDGKPSFGFLVLSNPDIDNVPDHSMTAVERGTPTYRPITLPRRLRDALPGDPGDLLDVMAKVWPLLPAAAQESLTATMVERDFQARRARKAAGETFDPTAGIRASGATWDLCRRVGAGNYSRGARVLWRALLELAPQ